MEKEPLTEPAGRKRLILLLVVLALVVAGGITHYGRIWYYERQLLRIAQEIVAEANRNDPLPIPEEGPEADVEIKVSCSFAYLLFGPKTGKITLIIKPRPHASNARIRGIVYLYRHDAGAWEKVESYHM
jgi:hypothetical protein